MGDKLINTIFSLNFYMTRDVLNVPFVEYTSPPLRISPVYQFKFNFLLIRFTVDEVIAGGTLTVQLMVVLVDEVDELQ